MRDVDKKNIVMTDFDSSVTVVLEYVQNEKVNNFMVLLRK